MRGTGIKLIVIYLVILMFYIDVYTVTPKHRDVLAVVISSLFTLGA